MSHLFGLWIFFLLKGVSFNGIFNVLSTRPVLNKVKKLLSKPNNENFYLKLKSFMIIHSSWLSTLHWWSSRLAKWRPTFNTAKTLVGRSKKFTFLHSVTIFTMVQSNMKLFIPILYKTSNHSYITRFIEFKIQFK